MVSQRKSSNPTRNLRPEDCAVGQSEDKRAANVAPNPAATFAIQRGFLRAVAPVMRFPGIPERTRGLTVEC